MKDIQRCECCTMPMPPEGECTHPIFAIAERQRDAAAERRMFPALRRMHHDQEDE